MNSCEQRSCHDRVGERWSATFQHYWVGSCKYDDKDMGASIKASGGVLLFLGGTRKPAYTHGHTVTLFQSFVIESTIVTSGVVVA